MKIRRIPFALFAIFALLLSGCQQDKRVLAVINAWALPAQAGGETKVYFIVNNPTNQADTLLSVSTPLDALATIHDSTGAELVDSVPIPANSVVNFEPGGMYVLLAGLTIDLNDGDTFNLNLTFQDAGYTLINVLVSETAPTPPIP